MTEKTPQDKLLEAAGVQKPATPAEELFELRERMIGSVEAMTEKAQKASLEAQQNKKACEDTFRQMQKFCRDSLPEVTSEAVKKLCQEELQKKLSPVEQSARQSIGQLETARDRLLSASGTLFLGPIIAGLLTVLVGAIFVRFWLLGDGVNEAKRYEAWGRKVDERIRSYPPKEQAKIYRWIGGKP